MEKILNGWTLNEKKGGKWHTFESERHTQTKWNGSIKSRTIEYSYHRLCVQYTGPCTVILQHLTYPIIN